MNAKRIIWSIVGVAVVIAGIAFLVWMYWSTSPQPRKVPAAGQRFCQTDQDCLCAGEKDFPGCVNGTCINGKCGWNSDTSGKTSTTTVQNIAASWQTYRNEQYGVEFKYPSDWVEYHESLNSIVNPDSSGVAKQKPANDERRSSRPYIFVMTIGRIENSQKLSLQELLDAPNQDCWEHPEKYLGCSERDNVDTWSKIVIAGYQAFQTGRGRTDKLENRLDRIYINRGTDYIFIDASNFSREFTEYDTHDYWSDFETILKTIKFNTSFDTSTWQTYRNEQYGFEVKFPESWLGYRVQNENNSINFQMPDSTWNGGWSTLIEIGYVPKSEWSAVESAEGRGVQYLGEHNSLVFFVRSGLAEPSDTLTKAAADIPQILSTFKFTQ